ncbi:SCP2 sterol-binding domain-containing protein [Mycolicibacterium sphagni]|uniref:SCP2 sterol-binding domain-containing protein n=1 Tax=Mycolicibacterium sphagni TaxID=1786 RepID=A0ABX2K1C0_9MYCO|nr:SCP2 sterol-binding domain-containing protein [Mycolicibacterium sphagni]NTY61859.1 SCP2 sterol-binding domain-containing protein [Mycolicibacterium sphagni]
MGFFKDANELDEYIGGVFREAGEHPESGPKLKAANIVMRVIYTDPDFEMTMVFHDDYQVISGPNDTKPDITLLMRGDTADQFWRGDYNLAVGLAKGQVKAKGPVNKILKLVPLTKPLFPMYRDKIAKKDGASA